MSSKDIVLAFSGGLDTSFCVPYLMERGYAVHTVFVDTGGVSAEEREYIEQRATELGAASHRTVDASQAIWDSFVTPLIWAGEFYQGQYPLLVSDRYLIVKASLERCNELGTKLFAHGCTGMGNDQVRFDLTVRALGDYTIVAPINENVLGVTISGGEIDAWEIPGEGAIGWCAPRAEWPSEPLRIELGFEKGVAVSLNGKAATGPEILAFLNRELAKYGVGRSLYTGDTNIGLKGRIVFEAPALTALLTAHRALEETVLSKQQNRFKPEIGRKWTEVAYEGFFNDPIKADLEAYLVSTQRKVDGKVIVETRGGSIYAVKVESKNLLHSAKATYAQAADWGVAEAEGFIKLYGMSSTIWAEVDRANGN
jgi:argininosuccinate synthase